MYHSWLETAILFWKYLFFILKMISYQFIIASIILVFENEIIFKEIVSIIHLYLKSLWGCW